MSLVGDDLEHIGVIPGAGPTHEISWVSSRLTVTAEGQEE
jgi:hypothetical protein